MRRLYAFALISLLGTGAIAEESKFFVSAHIPAGDGGWDFASVDQQTNRLFVARSNGVTAIDLATRNVTDHLVDGARVHGVLPLESSSFAISTNGNSANAFLFDKASGKIESVFATGQNPDALLLEPKTGFAVIFNGKSHDATLIDVDKKAVVGTIVLDGKPEVAAADGTGRVFVNLEDKSVIEIVDIVERKVVASYALPNCEAPTGLAFDAPMGALISACDNNVAKVLDAKTGRDLATLKIGKGPDGVLLDTKRRRAFIPAGDGTLTVLSLAPTITVVETVLTAKGAKTGAVDPATGDVYLPTASFAPPEKEGARPQPVPGTFNIVVVSSRN